MGGVKDISDKVRAVYIPEQNYLALQRRNWYQDRVKSYRGFNYYQQRRN